MKLPRLKSFTLGALAVAEADAAKKPKGGSVFSTRFSMPCLMLDALLRLFGRPSIGEEGADMAADSAVE